MALLWSILSNQKSGARNLSPLTAEVIFHKADYPAWNQIHLIAMLPSGVFHFKKDFNEGLIKVNAPNFAENFERLGQIRKFTSKVSAAREL